MTTHISLTLLLGLLLGLFWCSVARFSQGKLIEIDNRKPRLDVDGNIINAHDGTYRRHGGYWYYHALEYGLCKEPPGKGCDGASAHGCGFHRDHNVSIWRSPDLSSGSWERRGTAVQCKELAGCSILFRPHLVENKRTGRFVLFVNYVGDGNSYNGNAVYSATHIEGPFTLENPVMNLSRLCPGPLAKAPCGEAQGGCGDFDVMVDGDGAAYIAYGCNFYMSIERLTETFYDTAPRLPGGRSNASAGGRFGGTVFPDYFVEAPAFFRRAGLYYLLYGHCCCFCLQGSGVIVYTAQHPMGPWTRQPGGDLACVPAPAEELAPFPLPGAVPTPGQGCLYGGSSDISVTRAQQNFVIEVPLGTTTRTDDEESTFLWTGDLWQQAPDGVKGHEGQYWYPLEFDSHGSIQKMKHLDRFQLRVP